tara:strand:- start:884 stop:2953 length:2070 start_codon:yes stop_codon:yes gene_type:complete
MANTFQQNLANLFTPGDDNEYVNGKLVNKDTGKAVDDSNAVVGNDGTAFNAVTNSVSNGVSNFVDTATNAASGIANDAKMGFDKLTLSEDEFVKKYGKDVVDDFNHRTKITSLANNKPNLTTAELKELGLNDDDIASYNFKVKANSDGSGGGGDDSQSGVNTTNDGANAGDDFTEAMDSKISQENILKMLETSGFIKSQEDLQELLKNPAKFLTDRGANLSEIAKTIQVDPDALGTMLNPDDSKYALGDLDKATVSTVDGDVKINIPTEQPLNDLTVDSALSDLNNEKFNVKAIEGTVTDDMLVDKDELRLDKKGLGTGVNEDGTVNYTGVALNDYAVQKFGSVVNTSTVDGKLLAEALGEGNYVDSKATILGQMDLISEQFVDNNGNPKIPSWAQGVYGSITTDMAFSGLTGSQKMGILSKGLMEASLSVAKDEAAFFQTLTTTNLSNKQQQIIQKAATMAGLDEAELGVIERSSKHNSQAFLDMNMTNLTNEQQAEMINVKSKVDALFTQTSENNLRNRMVFETEADFQKFYAGVDLEAQTFMEKLNSDIKMFNSGEINDFEEFYATLENRRQEFTTNLQWLIDESNAGWRRSVESENTGLTFDAAATDVKSILGLSQEGLNRTWNEVDIVLDYLFKGAQSEEELAVRLLLGEMDAESQSGGGSSWFSTLVSGITKVVAAKYTAGLA